MRDNNHNIQLQGSIFQDLSQENNPSEDEKVLTGNNTLVGMELDKVEELIVSAAVNLGTNKEDNIESYNRLKS